MNDEQLQELISEKSDKLIAKLEWHDTLDVQNAVRKAYKQGFKDGVDYTHESQKAMVKEEVKPKTSKSKKTSKTKKKK